LQNFIHLNAISVFFPTLALIYHLYTVFKMNLEGYDKKPSKKELNYRKRCFGMTSLDRIQVAHKRKNIGRLQNIALRIGDDSGSDTDEYAKI